MKFHPDVENALHRFLSAPTWFKGNEEDVNRWYEFVDAYERKHGCDLVDAELRRELVSRVTVKGRALHEHLEGAISQRVDDAVAILGFLKHTRTPS